MERGRKGRDSKLNQGNSKKGIKRVKMPLMKVPPKVSTTSRLLVAIGDRMERNEVIFDRIAKEG